MGVLVTAKSEPSFLLEREDFARALRGLQRLAKTLPDDLETPDAVAKAKTLKDAFEVAYWAPRFDAFGDLVGLEYLVDKAPRDATDYWPVPMLEELAKAGARGRFYFSADDYACAFELEHDGVYRSDIASSVLAVVGREPERGKPGESVIVRVKAGERIPDAPLAVKVHSDWAIEGKSGDIIRTSFDASPMRDGEVRAITVELAAEARGHVDIVIQAGDATAYGSFAVEPSADEIANPWTVIDRRSAADRSAIVPQGARKKTLERLRRFAVRNCERPGAAFLRELGEANELDAALAMLGLELRAAERRQQELVFVRDRLPGAEHYFGQLLDLLAKSAGRHCRISLSLAFAEAPTLWREYRVSYHGGIRCSVSPRNS